MFQFVVVLESLLFYYTRTYSCMICRTENCVYGSMEATLLYTWCCGKSLSWSFYSYCHCQSSNCGTNKLTNIQTSHALTSKASHVCRWIDYYSHITNLHMYIIDEKIQYSALLEWKQKWHWEDTPKIWGLIFNNGMKNIIFCEFVSKLVHEYVHIVEFRIYLSWWSECWRA